MKTQNGWTRRRFFKTMGGVVLSGASFQFLGTPFAQAHREAVEDEIISIIIGDSVEGKPPFFYEVAGSFNEQAQFEVSADKTIRFAFENQGQLVHDVHFGRKPILEKGYYEENLSPPFDMLEIYPQQKGEITFTFKDEQIGEWEIGCFQPGHYEAGQKVPFRILPAVNRVVVDLAAGGEKGWTPDVIRVKLGTEVTLRMTTIDGDDHSFVLSGWNFEVPILAGTGVQEFTFTADKLGTHAFVCGDAYCEWHPKMFGQFIVEA